MNDPRCHQVIEHTVTTSSSIEPEQAERPTDSIQQKTSPLSRNFHRIIHRPRPRRHRRARAPDVKGQLITIDQTLRFSDEQREFLIRMRRAHMIKHRPVPDIPPDHLHSRRPEAVGTVRILGSGISHSLPPP
nr:hypothetical protein GCM10023233_26760 [Brevibacterium otitidis]